MTAYVLQRIVAVIPVMLVVATVAFVLMHLAPGDPAAIILGTEGLAGIEQVHQRLGLDRPLLIQLSGWLANAVRGDLGDSFFLGRSVSGRSSNGFP